jgi:hypothetical protein
MKKRRFLIIAFVLLAIGSGAVLYASVSSPDTAQFFCDSCQAVEVDAHDLMSVWQDNEETLLPHYILVGGSAENCSKCNGSGKVRCVGRWPYGSGCQMPNNCLSCGNTGWMTCYH